MSTKPNRKILRDLREKAEKRKHKPLTANTATTYDMKEVKGKGAQPDKVWTWKTISIGDCQMTEGELDLSPSGVFYWQSFVETSDSGDVWLMLHIDLLDRNGVELYRIPQFDGPTMDNEGQWYPMFKKGFYPANLFPYITGCRITYHC
jgi:hypothetical protein